MTAKMMNIWDVEKQLKEKGYSRCNPVMHLHGGLDGGHISRKAFNGGFIEFFFNSTTNGNFSRFDLILSNGKDVTISLKNNTVDEFPNLLKKEELLKKALENAIATLREAESE